MNKQINFGGIFDEINDTLGGSLSDRVKDKIRRKWRIIYREQKTLSYDTSLEIIKKLIVDYLSERKISLEKKIIKYTEQLVFIRGILEDINS